MADQRAATAAVRLDKRTPEHVRELVALFLAMEFGLNALGLYQHTPEFSAVKQSIESSCQR